MPVKYIFGLLLLLVCNILLAQESNLVIYDRSHHQTVIEKSEKKEEREWTAAIEDREAQLIYSSDHLLLMSLQGTDTVFLSKINKTSRNFFGHRRMFYVTYNNKSDVITLLFCHRKNAKKFKIFLQENGGQYRRNIVWKIIIPPLLLSFGVIPFVRLPPLWRKWKRTCH